MSACKKRGFVDPNQIEFGITWRTLKSPFRLRGGDVIRFDGRLCRVVRVNECAAVVIMNRKVREFKTALTSPFVSNSRQCSSASERNPKSPSLIVNKHKGDSPESLFFHIAASGKIERLHRIRAGAYA